MSEVTKAARSVVEKALNTGSTLNGDDKEVVLKALLELEAEVEALKLQPVEAEVHDELR